jgi:hypothetical protein
MLIPFGVLSAAGAAVGDVDAYELISTTVLGTATSSVTFSSLGDYASTYKHLQMRAVVRVSRATFGDSYGGIRFNGDTGNNYAWHALQGQGSSVTSEPATSQSSMRNFWYNTTTATANAFGAGVMDILDAYSTTKNTTIRTLGGMAVSGDSRIALHSGVWLDTSSLTSVTMIDQNGGNFQIGSRFSLYGVRG